MEVTLVRALSVESAARREVPSELPRRDAALANANASRLRSDGKALRVLVIDDEPLIVRTLTSALASRVTVVGETVPERALALILADPAFDAIVCDVMMPGLTGIDIHERIARDKPGHETRFVFITGGAYTARAREYLDRVPNARLTKPFDAAALLAAIEKVAD
jgi:CheY-like chemotaxis protein